MHGLVRCVGCGWVWESVAAGGYDHCRCGVLGAEDTMEPTDGSTLPPGATINPIVIRRLADASSLPPVVTHHPA